MEFFSGFRVNDLWFLTEAAGRTLLIAGLSISLGSVLGILFGWLLSISGRFGAMTLNPFLDVFRSVPLLIQLVLFFNLFPIIGLPLDPFTAGVIVLSVYPSALVSVLGYVELLRASQILITRTQEPFLILAIAGAFYFALSYPISRYAAALEKRWAQ